MRPIISATLFCVVFVNLAISQEKTDNVTRAKTIAPFLEDDAIALARIDLARFDAKGILADLERQLAGEVKKELSEVISHVEKLRSAIVSAGGKEVYVVLNLADAPAHAPFAIFTTTPRRDVGALVKAIRMVSRLAPGSEGMACESLADAADLVYAGSKPTLTRLLKNLRAPDSRPELAKAFEVAGDAALQLVLLPSDDHRRVVKEMIPQLPVELGGGATQPLVDGLRFAVLSIDVAPKPSLRFVIQARDPQSAEAHRDVLLKAHELIAGHPQVKKHLPEFSALAKALMPRLVTDRVVIELGEGPKEAAAFMAILGRFARETRAEAERRVTVNNLRQIGLALHEHHDSNNHFPPPANYDTAGKPLLSWRVHVLPYFGEEAMLLYKQFRLNERWDSEHNKMVIPKMPAVYRGVNEKLAAEGRTTFLAPLGETTVFPGAKGLEIREIKDGTSNTILVLHAPDELAVPWTKPEDWKFDPKDPKQGIIGGRAVIFAVFCDASVHSIPGDIDAPVFGRLVMRNDGQPVELP